MGSAVYQIVKSAPFLKEEDYIPSVFSFKKNSCKYNIYKISSAHSKHDIGLPKSVR
jgi:hypothetical protein